MNLQRLIHSLRADLHPGTERSRLVLSAAGTASLRAASAVIAFLASLLYARVLGPHDFGLYAYVAAWVAVLTIPASLGIPNYLVREGAKHLGHIALLRHWADRRLALTGLLAGLMLACAAFLPGPAGAGWMFVAAAPIPLLSNLSDVRQSLLQARGRILRSQWPQQILAPLLTLLLLAILWLWRGAFRPIDVLIATAVAALVQLAINAAQLRQASTDGTTDHRDFVARVKSALPFMWLSAMFLVMTRVDLILLGNLKGAREAGIYTIAARAAELIPFFLTAINTTIAPKISNLYHAGEHDTLQRLITGAARRLLWITLPIALFFIVAARPLITFFYGESYAEGATAMQLLAFAQFFTILSGPVGILLNMTKHAASSANTFAIGAVLNIVLNFALIPGYGYTGAAAATTISIVLCNGLRWYLVRRHLQIRPSAFGI